MLNVNAIPSNTRPKPLNCFDKSFSLKEIIQQLRATLQQFQLRPHVPSSAYCCTSNTFILDGTCKVAFKVCSIENCMNALATNTTVCSEYINYIANAKHTYIKHDLRVRMSCSYISI